METFEEIYENNEKDKFNIGETVELLRMPDGKSVAGIGKSFGEIYEVNEESKTVKVSLLFFGAKKKSDLEFKFEDIEKSE